MDLIVMSRADRLAEAAIYAERLAAELESHIPEATTAEGIAALVDEACQQIVLASRYGIVRKES